MQNIPIDFPDVLRIETAGKCNFNCIHCPTGTQPNKRPVLSMSMFNHIIDQLVAHTFIPRVVVLYHGGEPLLNKNLSLYIRVLKEMGIRKTSITTNASLLNEERSKELIMAGLDELQISFDGQCPDENNDIRKGGGFYMNAANVKSFCKVRKALGRNNPNIIIGNVQICDRATLETIHNKDKQVTLKNAPTYLIEYFSDEHDEMEFISFPAMVWPGYEKFGNLDTIYFDAVNPKYCGPLFETFTILSNGDVVLCCYDLKGELVLGNIYRESVFDIWNSEEYSNIRINYRRQKYCRLCKKCNVVLPHYLCKM